MSEHRSDIERRSRRLTARRASTRRELVRRLQRARSFMREQWATALSLPEIAREACLSPFHFHRSFRAFFGETPHAYLSRLRLDRAAERLRRTDRSITDIALDVGFDSPSNFSRAFKYRFHGSPQEYRRRFSSRR